MPYRIQVRSLSLKLVFKGSAKATEVGPVCTNDMVTLLCTSGELASVFMVHQLPYLEPGSKDVLYLPYLRDICGCQ